MSIQDPPVSLDNSCSVIHDNTLYSFSHDGFLSLSLEPGAEWKELEMGTEVTGATCVGTTPSDESQSAFFVVGGTAASADYPGLQKFTYSTGNWTTITPTNLFTKNRQGHGSAYVRGDDAIVVYAGDTNGGTGLSTTTFSIQASEPYGIISHSENVPSPAVRPIILPWSNDDAVMVGGSATNKAVFLYNKNAGWRNYGATLADPITKDTTEERAILVQGDDGSKSLVTFDMTNAPPKISRYTLRDAAGSPVLAATDVSANGNSKSRRDLTLQDWPDYNSTFAPTATRKNFALAQGDNGLVVLSGGGNSPLGMFNAQENKWLNTTAFFSESEQSILAVSTSSSVTTTSTTSSTSTAHSTSTSSFVSTTTTTTHSSAAATTTDAAASPTSTGKHEDSGYSSNTILGITLGSILGFMALLGLLLLLLRRCRQRRNHAEAGHQRRASGVESEEKETLGFAKDTLPPPSPGHFRGHHPQLSQESYSSMAILMGRVDQQKPGMARKPSKDSEVSSLSSFHDDFKGTIGRPVPQATVHPVLQGEDEYGSTFAPAVAEARPRATRRTTATQEEQEGMRRSSGWNRYWSGGSALQILGFGGPKRATGVSEQSSRYSQGTVGGHNSRATQDSATVPPLNFEGPPEVNSVNSGSPVVSQSPSHLPLGQGMAGKIERPCSNASSGYSSGIPESVNESWDPRAADKPWGTDRAPSSAYDTSFYHTTALAPSSKPSPPSGVSNQPQLAMASKSSDMSWLNLGDQSRGV